MAKYKLTMVHELEDNEQALNESEAQLYVQDAISRSIAGWDKVRASLKVNDKLSTFKAKATSIDKPKEIGWPWHCSADVLPDEGNEHVIACVWDDDRWRELSFYKFDHKRQFFENDVFRLKPSPNVWWRTVAEPEPLDKLSYERNRQEMSEAAKR